MFGAVKANWETHKWWDGKKGMGKSGLRREWVKLLSPYTVDPRCIVCRHPPPPGCETLRAGETFNSPEMEAHYPQ